MKYPQRKTCEGNSERKERRLQCGEGDVEKGRKRQEV